MVIALHTHAKRETVTYIYALTERDFSLEVTNDA